MLPAEDRAARAAAFGCGESRYAGRPCKHGHSGERYSRNGICVDCAAANFSRWRDANKGHREEYRKSWHEANKGKVSESGKKYYEDNKDRAKAVRKAWRDANPERHSENHKKWAAANRSWCSRYRRDKRRNDPQECMANRLRCRMARAIAANGARKSGASAELLGCSFDELTAHIESKFKPGMSWGNRNEWHVDHIRPLASFDLTDPAQQRAACHYSNLQPLWAGENLAKGCKWSEAA